MFSVDGYKDFYVLFAVISIYAFGVIDEKMNTAVFSNVDFIRTR